MFSILSSDSQINYLFFPFQGQISLLWQTQACCQSVMALQMKVNWEHGKSSSVWFSYAADYSVDSQPPSLLWGHLDLREKQFITLQHGKDKPHLMKQPGQSCIKSHRTVSCTRNLHAAPIPAVGQWHSRRQTIGQAASSPLMTARAPFLKRAIVTVT